jgi:hypothetical protein
MLAKVKGLVGRVSFKVRAAAIAAIALLSLATSASATTPNSGNADIDVILNEMGNGFSVANNAFVYLAVAAVGITVLVVVFFWIRGKFKQAVSGA